MTWADIAREVGAALGEVGQVGVLVKKGEKTSGGRNPTYAESTRHEVNVVQSRFSMMENLAGKVTGDNVFTVEARGVAPEKDDKLEFAGWTHEIVEVKATQPGGQAVVYRVQTAHATVAQLHVDAYDAVRDGPSA